MSTSPKLPEQAFTLYDQFAHGRIDRRTFMQGISKLAIGGLTTGIMLNALMPDYALAEQVSFNDPDIQASFDTFPSPHGHGEGRGYLVSPRNINKPAPTVLVVHENRGLNPYIKDVARRLAKQGFIAFAPDGLYPLGGYPGNDEKGKAMQASMDQGKLYADFVAATDFLADLDNGNGKVGVVGFCYGGGVANKLACEKPAVINGAVPFYGIAPPLDNVANIHIPLLIQLAEKDDWVNAKWPDYEAALKAHKVNYQAYTYADTRHGFHNDSTARYQSKAATLAWQRTIDFFKQYL